jgi:ATP-dependent DNA ligase
MVGEMLLELDRQPVRITRRRRRACARAGKAVCKLGLEGIVSKKLDAPYKSGPSKAWLKIKNPKSPAATRAIDGTF